MDTTACPFGIFGEVSYLYCVGGYFSEVSYMYEFVDAKIGSR